MKVYIKNKFLSLRGDSAILDENLQPIYVVEGKLFSLSHMKKLYDRNNNLLYIIKNRVFNFFRYRTYIYDQDHQLIATIKDKMFNFKREYFIEGCEDEIRIEGKFIGLTSKIIKNGQVCGIIRRKITFLADAFELEASEEDMPFMIAVVIAMDNLIDKKQAENS